jgi:hypothetical protein
MKKIVLLLVLLTFSINIFADESEDKRKFEENVDNFIAWIKSGDINAFKDFYFNSIDSYYDLDYKDGNLNDKDIFYSIQYLIGAQSGIFGTLNLTGTKSIKIKDYLEYIKKDNDIKRFSDVFLFIHNKLEKNASIDNKEFKYLKTELMYFQNKYKDCRFILSLSLILDYLNEKVISTPQITFGNTKKKGDNFYLFTMIKNNTSKPMDINPLGAFYIIDGENQIKNMAFDMESNLLHSIELEPNLKTEGWLVFSMPKNQFNYQLMYKPLFTDYKIVREVFDTTNIKNFENLRIVF